MSEQDPVLQRLAELPPGDLDPELSRRIHSAARRALQPRPVPLFFTAAIVASVLCYLGWALRFTTALY